jgi:histidyl-tRNA synthetase
LVKEFGGPADVSGVGFGIGLERLILLLESEGVQIPTANDLDVYVVGIGEETSHETLKLVQAIRGFGFSADRDFLDRKPKAQFKSADREHAQFVMTLGQNELDNGTVNFKSMATGEEESVRLVDVYEDFPQIYDQHFEE